MKVISILLAATVLLLCSFGNLQKKKKVVFFGDSITWLSEKPDGFLSQLRSRLLKENISDVELVNAGVSGDKVYDLYLRQDAVLAQNPDAVVIWIGVNDVWHKQLLHTGTDADKFERFYRALIKKFTDRNIHVYLCTPAVIGEKPAGDNANDKELDKYSDIIRKIAADQKLTLIDLRQQFTQYIKSHNTSSKEKGILTTDGVHLNEKGNAFVAKLFYDTLKQGSFAPQR